MIRPPGCAQCFANETNLRRHYVRHHQCGYHSRDGPYKLDADELDARMAAIRRCQWGPRRRREEKLKKTGTAGGSDRDREAAPSRWPIASDTASWVRWAIPVSTPVDDRPGPARPAGTGQRPASGRPVPDQ